MFFLADTGFCWVPRANFKTRRVFAIKLLFGSCGEDRPLPLPPYQKFKRIPAPDGELGGFPSLKFEDSPVESWRGPLPLSILNLAQKEPPRAENWINPVQQESSVSEQEGQLPTRRVSTLQNLVVFYFHLSADATSHEVEKLIAFWKVITINDETFDRMLFFQSFKIETRTPVIWMFSRASKYWRTRMHGGKSIWPWTTCISLFHDMREKNAEFNRACWLPSVPSAQTAVCHT